MGSRQRDKVNSETDNYVNVNRNLDCLLDLDGAS
jgi:hypothetical protein